MGMPQQVSGKVTNALLNYLERQGVPQSVVFDVFDGPAEFLKDAYFWLEANEVEKIFARAANHLGDPKLGHAVGSQIADLGSLGALDYVFKLIPSKKDYYRGLERFFSYMILPHQDFKELELADNHVRFKPPFLRSTHPQIFDFIRGAIENLPKYTGHGPSTSQWFEELGEMVVSWDSGQPSLFAEEPAQHYNPHVLSQLSGQIERYEKIIENLNRELSERQKSIEQLQSEFARDFNEKLHQTQMPGLTQLASGVAHEINNPLSFVTSNLERFEDYLHRLQSYSLELEKVCLHGVKFTPQNLKALKDSLDIEFVRQETPLMIEESKEGLKRVKGIVRDLSGLAHPGSAKSEDRVVSKVEEILESSVKVFTQKLEGRIEIVREYGFEKPIEVYPVRLGQVFMNLISNAIDAIPARGTITLRTQGVKDRVRIDVLDTGVGMTEEIQGKIFSPFFTTKEAGKGTGLGLLIAKNLVDLHGGEIQFESKSGVGTCFSILLPLKG